MRTIRQAAVTEAITSQTYYVEGAGANHQLLRVQYATMLVLDDIRRALENNAACTCVGKGSIA